MRNNTLEINPNKMKSSELEVLNYALFKVGYSKQKNVSDVLSLIKKYFKYKLNLTGFEVDALVLYKFLEYAEVGDPAEFILKNVTQKEPSTKISKRKRRNRSKKLRVILKENQATKTGILRSPKWRALRYEAFTKYGNKCACCGAGPTNGTVLHVDHIKPISKFPALGLDINNLQILCEECNMGKSNKFDNDWTNEG